MRSLGVAIPGLALALAGPAAVGFVSRYATKFAPAFLVHLLSVTCIILIVLGVFALARSREGLSLHRLGFARVAWSSLTIGLVLACSSYSVRSLGLLGRGAAQYGYV